MARRGKTPPYELMRSVTRPTGEGDAPAAPSVSSAQGSADEPGEATGAAGAWGWAGVGVPIVLRVPRGVAVLLGIGLIALVVMAYWVGHSRGDAAGAERARAELTESPVVAGREPPAPAPDAVGQDAVGQAGGDVAAPASPTPRAADDAGQSVEVEPTRRGAGGVFEAGASDDPREPGLNYMIVATYDPPNARELAEFLAGEHGLETVLRPVNNGRRIQVWVVDRGFTGQELGREAYLAYRAGLREIGRTWRQHQPALRDALEQMYPTRYDP